MFSTVKSQDENPFAKLVTGQTIVEVPRFDLECGEVITKVPVAYKTWGKLNDSGTNCMVITHALTGSADVADWWGPLLGRGRAFDPTKYFIICLNSLGSPYGSASPVTMDWEYSDRYGPEFPLCTIRDDVRIHRMILDTLGVKEVAICVGGSMGGMLVLEWMFQKKTDSDDKYVKSAVALATSARHSAWCISWGEAQRQCIYSDPKYKDGYYSLDDPPISGLGAARMAALLTYRSRNSFEARFGRQAPTERQKSKSLANRRSSESGEDSSTEDQTASSAGEHTDDNADSAASPPQLREENWKVHNDGSSRKKSFEEYHRSQLAEPQVSDSEGHEGISAPQTPPLRHSNGPPGSAGSHPGPTRSGSISSISSIASLSGRPHRMPRHYFSAQSYLRYQANKFVGRFDANCYISITRKLDTHDVGRDRPEFDNDAAKALQSLEQPTLVIGISSDALFTLSEQIFIAKNVPHSSLKKINSNEGHDAFLLEFEEINKLIQDFEKENLKDIMETKGNYEEWDGEKDNDKKESVFGEAEDVASW
ncbi:DEKNAAC103756 [Brettanomyces naardenensis]|uniref:DEKNAAC103756 n=1 Tax=Brettanomyces naardenensis TaxID=13370 RepID=A0A448YP80_BRENA|nr:DEKNAAC103756 [Brettanomyces naardenensis]